MGSVLSLDGVPPLAGSFVVGAGDAVDGVAQDVTAGLAGDDAAHWLSSVRRGGRFRARASARRLRSISAPQSAPVVKYLQSRLACMRSVIIVRFLNECCRFGFMGRSGRCPISPGRRPGCRRPGALWPLVNLPT